MKLRNNSQLKSILIVLGIGSLTVALAFLTNIKNVQVSTWGGQIWENTSQIYYLLGMGLFFTIVGVSLFIVAAIMYTRSD